MCGPCLVNVKPDQILFFAAEELDQNWLFHIAKFVRKNSQVQFVKAENKLENRYKRSSKRLNATQMRGNTKKNMSSDQNPCWWC